MNPLATMTPLAAALQLLEERIWRDVDTLGSDVYSSQASLDNQRLADYAAGIRDTYVGMIEYLHDHHVDEGENLTWGRSVEHFSHAIWGALGEALHRRQSKKSAGAAIRALLVEEWPSKPKLRPCRGRNLNKWMCQVRAWRIRLTSEYDDEWYPRFCDLRREVNGSGGSPPGCYWDREVLMFEVNALTALRTLLCFADEGWRAERDRRASQGAKARKEEANED